MPAVSPDFNPMTSVVQFLRDVREMRALPEVRVNLMSAAAAGNDPFYQRLVQDFYRGTRRRHRKFPLVRQYEYGVALCPLPRDFESYFMLIEASARRNYKKSLRSGYVFRRIAYNDFLQDITDIRRSTDVRQGTLPDEFLKKEVRPISDPPSRNRTHDYPYFGILKDGRLVAYAGCLVSGEICIIEQIYGHAAHQADGIVPMLIIGMAEHILANCPEVRYYAYGTFFGAGETLRRFKKKFRFLPHRVRWVAG